MVNSIFLYLALMIFMSQLLLHVRSKFVQTNGSINFVRHYQSPPIDYLLIFIIVFIGYSLTKIDRMGAEIGFQHHNYLAEALLHGRLEIIDPPTNHDLSIVDGKKFVPFPMLPAIFAMPFVAIFGLKFNIIYLSIFVASISTTLVYKLANRFQRDKAISLAITFGFAFGTVHWWGTIREGVWFVAHTFSVLFGMLLMLEATNRKRPMILALLLGCSFMCRQMTILGTIFCFFVIYLKYYEEDKNIFQNLFKVNTFFSLFRFGLVLGLFVVGYLVVNYLRFGNPFDTGYSYIGAKDQFEEHGLFSLAYLKKNLYYFLIAPPDIKEGFPYLKFDGWGTAIIFTSPFLYLSLLTFFQKWRQTFHIALACTIILTPILLYFNTGFYQFGFRFIQDILPYLILLLCMQNFNRITKKVLLGAVAISVTIHTIGAQVS